MDRGQRDTEARLRELERKINKEYAQAIDEIEEELTDYFQRYKIKDETWQKWVADGKRTEAEYEAWRKGQLAVGKRWNTQKTIIATELAHANEIAKNMVKNEAPQIFADNFNWATYQVEKDSGVDTAFTLYSKESVERLLKDNPEVLPPIGKKVAKEIAEGKAIKWNKQQLQSVMMQGILQGDSIPKLATRLANTVGDRDRKAAIRNARTMSTAAQNAGRVNAYKRAQDKGVDLEQMWMAVMDNRTRHSHRWLDGEVRPVGEAFSNGCEYPADPKGDPAEIYNCRCTLRGVVKGMERRAYKYKDTSGLEGMTYDEWRNAKAKSNPITLQEEKGKAIKQSYINEYRGYVKAETENQRYGRNKETVINSTYIESGEYRKKFDNITDNKNVNRAVYQAAKEMLSHRSGTKYEDMYWIDGNTGKIIAKEIAQKVEEQVTYSKSTKAAIKGKENLIALHNHPESMPPSARDLNSTYTNGYAHSLAICHDGKVYEYSSREIIRLDDYNAELAKYLKRGYDEEQSQIMALETLKKSCDFDFKEIK